MLGLVVPDGLDGQDLWEAIEGGTAGRCCRLNIFHSRVGSNLLWETSLIGHATNKAHKFYDK